MNMSRVPAAGCQWRPGVTFGFAQLWRLADHWSLALETVGFYAGSRLVDKNFLSYPMSVYIYRGDLNISSVFLEWPLVLRYTARINSRLQGRIVLGGSLAIGVGDDTRRRIKEHLYRWDNSQAPDPLPCHIDLTVIEDVGDFPLIGRKNQSPLAMQFGIGLVAKPYSVELRGRYGKMHLWAYNESVNHLTVYLLLGLNWPR